VRSEVIPHDYYSESPINFHFHGDREPAPDSNYAASVRDSIGELHRARRIIGAAFAAAAQSPARIAAADQWYANEIARREAWLGETVPEVTQPRW
jgi:hypothetical protein